MTSRLSEYEFCNLPDASKAHLFALELLASKLGNVLRMDAKWIERQISATEPVDFAPLQSFLWVVEAADEAEASILLTRCERPASTAASLFESVAIAETEREEEEEEEVEGEAEKSRTCAPHGSKGQEDEALYPKYFEEWWSFYPKQVGKRAAFRAYRLAEKELGRDAHAKLIEAVRKYSVRTAGTNNRYIAHPKKWLEEGRWDDSPPSPSRHPCGRDSFGVGG